MNDLWAGLGYYRRAKYLHSGAQHVVAQLGGSFPTTSVELQKIPGRMTLHCGTGQRARSAGGLAWATMYMSSSCQQHGNTRVLMPAGIGAYTGAAIASIACNERAAVVDANVVRVLARLLKIG